LKRFPALQTWRYSLSGRTGIRDFSASTEVFIKVFKTVSDGKEQIIRFARREILLIP